MRGILFSILLFSLCLQAQNEYPALNVYGLSIDSFVPANWKVISTAEGDLNKDDLIDLVFVIEKNEAELVLSDSASFVKPLRILGVYFQQKTGLFLKHTQSNSFIICKDNLEMGEPFQNIYITNEGYLDINFQFWKKETIWLIESHSFNFLLQNNKFELVSHSKNETNRETGDTVDIIINYISKKMTIISSNFLIDKPPVENISKIKVDKLYSIDGMKSPIEFLEK